VIKFVSHLWLSPGTPVSSTNESDRHDIIEILLKVGLNTITVSLTNTFICKIETEHSDFIIFD